MQQHRHATIIRSLLALAIAVFAGNTAIGDERCCSHCGRPAACQKVCRLVEQEQKIETTCWGCKVEEFCVPGPSKPGCQHCEIVCDTCGDNHHPQAPQAQPKKFVWTDWIPPCTAKIFTKKKLMKKTVTQKVPGYKWVVEELCDHCEANCPVAVVPPGVEVPSPPAIPAKLKYGLADSEVANVAWH